MKNNSCTCIIPFYNEQEGVIDVVKKLIKIKEFDEIILVDDWSEDKGLSLVQDFLKTQKHSNISVISYKKNKGKSNAIKQGLQKVKTTYVCMFDSDLKGIKINEISYMIKDIYRHPEVDMGILRRIHAKRYIKIFYRELVLSGQRILKTQDLKEIFKKKFERYQLEVAINAFMQKKRKIVLWYPFTGENTFKSEKRWFFDGIKKDIFMFRDIFKYLGLRGYIKHSFSFSPINEKKYNPSKKIR